MSESISERPHRWPPTVGICGKSGSGKTLLIERLVPRLIERALRVAVVKHCTHRIDADRPGKDSDRIFQAGADVLAAGPGQSFARFHADQMPLGECLRRIAEPCDLVLVEGCRDAAIPKIWIGREPDGAHDVPGDVVLFLKDATVGCADAEETVWQVVERTHAALPILAAVVVGKLRRRTGRSRRSAEQGLDACLERAVSAVSEHAAEVLLAGPGDASPALEGLRSLPGAPGVEGPMAIVVSALRWQPHARWLVLGGDLPWITAEAVSCLLKQTRPGLDAVMPAFSGHADREPLIALFEPSASWSLELAAARGESCLRRALDPARVLRTRLPGSP